MVEINVTKGDIFMIEKSEEQVLISNEEVIVTKTADDMAYTFHDPEDFRMHVANGEYTLVERHPSACDAEFCAEDAGDSISLPDDHMTLIPLDIRCGKDNKPSVKEHPHESDVEGNNILTDKERGEEALDKSVAYFTRCRNARKAWEYLLMISGAKNPSFGSPETIDLDSSQGVPSYPAFCRYLRKCLGIKHLLEYGAASRIPLRPCRPAANADYPYRHPYEDPVEIIKTELPLYVLKRDENGIERPLCKPVMSIAINHQTKMIVGVWISSE